MREGTVFSIFIGPIPAEPMRSVTEVKAIPGKGLEGDRFSLDPALVPRKTGPDREATLIEVETLEALKRDFGIDFSPGESRRNIITRGVALNHLVGREFRVGEVKLRGIRLCEPCDHLVKLTGKEVKGPLLHRGGLRAQVLSEGTIRVGDSIDEV